MGNKKVYSVIHYDKQENCIWLGRCCENWSCTKYFIY